jgi:hypothetical protein
LIVSVAKITFFLSSFLLMDTTVATVLFVHYRMLTLS